MSHIFRNALSRTSHDAYESGNRKDTPRSRFLLYRCQRRCTSGLLDDDADHQDGAFSYLYKLRPGVNTNSHAIVSLQTSTGATLISIESCKTGWYARIIPLDSAKHLGRATGCEAITMTHIFSYTHQSTLLLYVQLQ